jgi:5-methylcytosine-specific restriction endonuclease McrA
MLDAGTKRVVPEGHSKRGISAEMIGKRVSLEASKRPSFESANRVPLDTTAKRSMMQEPVLVLNATYEPINVTAVRRAMVLLLKGVAQAEEMHNAEVHSAAHSHKVPSVIRLLAYRHIPQQSRALSRKNILLRDRNTCQFCGRVFPSSELTLDHVVPRSRGGRSSWENLVACCYRCNNSKGNRTPEEVGFKLARRPRPFTLHTSRQLMRMIGHRDDRWRKYLFY